MLSPWVQALNNRYQVRSDNDFPELMGMVTNCIADLARARVFNKEAITALKILKNRVRRTHTGNCIFACDLLDIFLKLPAVSRIMPDIVCTINQVLYSECQDHTADLIDRIKLRIFIEKISAFDDVLVDSESVVRPSVNTVNNAPLQKKQDHIVVNSGNKVIHWERFICQIKLLFHEDQLIQLLLARDRQTGDRWIKSGESVEIKIYLKNRLSQSVCRFVNHRPIVQRFEGLGRAYLYDQYDQLESEFKNSVEDKGRFLEFITGLCRDEHFLSFLENHDASLKSSLQKIKNQYGQSLTEYEGGISGPDAQAMENEPQGAYGGTVSVISNTDKINSASAHIQRPTDQQYKDDLDQLGVQREQALGAELSQYLAQKIAAHWDTAVEKTHRPAL